jgi:hypothetical protein
MAKKLKKVIARLAALEKSVAGMLSGKKKPQKGRQEKESQEGVKVFGQEEIGARQACPQDGARPQAEARQKIQEGRGQAGGEKIAPGEAAAADGRTVGAQRYAGFRRAAGQGLSRAGLCPAGW